MRKSVASMLILATAAVSTSAVAADALSECYRTADNRLEVQACLKKELAETEKFYDDIVDRVASVFSSPVLAVLNSCDTLLDMWEQQKRCNDAALQRQSEVLHDGMRVAPCERAEL